MKKTLSLALSFIMLITSLTAVSTSVFAATIADAPALTLGTPIDISVPVTQDVQDEAQAAEMLKNIYYAKFTPEETDYYEFIFDESFKNTTLGAVMTVVAESGADADDYLNMGMWMKLSDDDDDLFGSFSDLTVNVATKLEAGKTYGIGVVNYTTGTLNTSVMVQKHTHNLGEVYNKSYVDSYSFEYNEDGEKYIGCSVNNCDYHETLEFYPMVKSVKLSSTKFTYNGKAKTPAVTVKDRKGNTLKKGTDYTVTYSKNKYVGTAKATIKFKGNYEGKITRNFKINPKGTSVAKVSAKSKGFIVKWKKQATQTTGYQIQYSTGAKFTKKTTKTVTVKGVKNTNKTVSKLKAKKKYFVRVRTYKTVSGTKYYSAWSKAKSVTTKK